MKTLADKISDAIRKDDEGQSERLLQFYKSAKPNEQEVLDEAFICLCGYSLATLISEFAGMDIDKLTERYQEWMREQGLQLGSADEHERDPSLTEPQRAWLQEFCAAWEAAEGAMSASTEESHSP